MLNIKFPKGVGDKNPKEDFFGHDPKFAYCCDKDCLLLGSI